MQKPGKIDLLCLGRQHLKDLFKDRNAQGFVLRSRSHKLVQAICISEGGCGSACRCRLDLQILAEFYGRQDILVGREDGCQKLGGKCWLVKGLTGFIVNEGRGRVDQVDR